VCTGGFTVVITSTHSTLWPVGSVHLKVVVLVPEEDVMTEVDAAFTLVIAAAGIINDIATVAINKNFRFSVLNLFNYANLPYSDIGKYVAGMILSTRFKITVPVLLSVAPALLNFRNPIHSWVFYS
jgi:hypothetical protein